MTQLSNRSKEILILIGERKNTYVNELSKLMENQTAPDSLVPNSWIANRLKIMSAMGLVASKKKGRINELSLTPKGRKLARVYKKESELVGENRQTPIEQQEKTLLCATSQ